MLWIRICIAQCTMMTAAMASTHISRLTHTLVLLAHCVCSFLRSLLYIFFWILDRTHKRRIMFMYIVYVCMLIARSDIEAISPNDTINPLIPLILFFSCYSCFVCTLSDPDFDSVYHYYSIWYSCGFCISVFSFGSCKQGRLSEMKRVIIVCVLVCYHLGSL